MASKKSWVPIEPREPLDASVFGSTTKTYISEYPSSSMTYVPMPRWEPPEGAYNELFITATKKGSAPQAMFLDYVQLKGVENINIDFQPGEPPRMTITLILGKVTYVEDDTPKE